MMAGHTIVVGGHQTASPQGAVLHVDPRPVDRYRIKARLRQALDTALSGPPLDPYLFSDHQGMRSMVTRTSRTTAMLTHEPPARAYETPCGPVWVRIEAWLGTPTVHFFSRPAPGSTAPQARLEVPVHDFVHDEYGPAGWDRGDLERFLTWIGLTPA